jgi:hypothetical protein
MVAFIDDYREVYGVEPICRIVPIAPSTDRAVKAQQADPNRQSARARRDADLPDAIAQIWDDNFQVYGVRKVWRALQRDGWAVARCTVERLMQQMGFQGALCAAARQKRPVRMRLNPARLIWSSATSQRLSRIVFGSRISPLWRPGAALSMSPSSSTWSHGGLWVGKPAARRIPGSCLTPWSKPSVIACRAAIRR